MQAGGPEIARHPLAQVLGLAHIEDFFILAQHLVDTGALGEVFEKAFYIKGHVSSKLMAR